MRPTTRTLFLAAGLMAPATALAQPATFTDLGTLTPGVPVTGSAPVSTTTDQVSWFKFTLASPVRRSDLTFLEIYNGTVSGGGSTDSELALYDAAGTLIQVDDDDGAGVSSALSFGAGSGTFLPSTTGTPVCGNGRDRDLPAGDYYVGVAYFSRTWNNGFVFSTSTTTLGATDVTIVTDTAAAAAEPAGTIDLGVLTLGTPIVRVADALPASTVQWYKLEVPNIGSSLGSYLDIDTENSALAPTNATRLSIYGENGTLQSLSTLGALPSAVSATATWTDTVDGSGSLSQLTFGVAAPARSAVGTGLAYNGRDGNFVRAGVYYIAVAGPGAAPSTTAVSGINFGHTSASANSGTINLQIDGAIVVTSPSGTGSAIPATVGVSTPVTLRVNVTPGSNPVSTGITVDVDASAVTGIAGTTALLDNGVAPDATAGDGIYSASILVDGATFPAAYVLPFTINDLEARSGSGNINLTVSAPTNPTGTATAVPPFGSTGDSFTARVTVTPGNFPPSTGLAVSLDASLVDGGTVNLLDNGVAPDVTAGDNIFSGTVTVGPGAASGASALPATISDAEARTNNANLNFTVIGPPPACPTPGVESFTFTNLDSEGAVGAATNGVAPFTPTSSAAIGSLRLTGRFLPNTSFTAEARIRIELPSGSFIDYQPFTTSGPTGVPRDLSEVTITIPCDGIIANSGPWAVRMWESVTDAAVPDGVWANLCLTLVETTPGGSGPVWQGDTCVGDAGDLPATAQVPSGTGPLTSIVGNLSSTSDADMYLVNICDFNAFDATTAPGTADTQLWLFNLDGTGVMFNDDDTVVAGSARINNSTALLSANGDYYLAVTRYNRDPVDSTGALLWNNTGAGGSFLGIRAPDGPGAANPIANWVNAAVGSSTYTIALAGTCYPSGGPVGCNRADITDIGDTGAGPDNQLTVDDIIAFVNTFGDAIGCPGTPGTACNRADITDIGDTGAGPDGELTVDDIIAYVNAFGDGCPA